MENKSVMFKLFFLLLHPDASVATEIMIIEFCYYGGKCLLRKTTYGKPSYQKSHGYFKQWQWLTDNGTIM